MVAIDNVERFNFKTKGAGLACVVVSLLALQDDFRIPLAERDRSVLDLAFHYTIRL